MRRAAILLAVISLFAVSCGKKSLLGNEEMRKMVEEAFQARKGLAENRSEILFAPFNTSLTTDERDAMTFLYSGMPVSDLAGYNGDFFLANTRLALRARDQYRWGRKLPPEIFLQYVLPVRVNNENLDSFRIKYYDEIYARVGELSTIEAAALELNHWCHEKVAYQPADSRTSAPESTILSARGRCGEESTFTVAALRTAGIPARQVYVPRWAHSDDNHAWVEVWTGEKWRFLGACEPEPVLDRGWFTKPASRSMMVHTKTYGVLPASDPLVKTGTYYNEVNNLGLYAETRRVTVRVTGESGTPVGGAKVEFRLCNYAELYPVATLTSDDNGECSLVTGRGDLLVWGSDGARFGLGFTSDTNDETVEISLDESWDGSRLTFDFRAPVPTRDNVLLPESAEQENRIALAREDSIRNAYRATWVYNDQLDALVAAGYSSERVEKALRKSEGNFRMVITLLQMAEKEQMNDALDLLEVVADKDLRDARAETLYDHLSHARKFPPTTGGHDIFVNYVLNPRIASEIIEPWRSYIQGLQDNETIEAFRNDPEILASWIKDNLRPAAGANYYRVPVPPRGTLELGVADQLSADIFFVACCRSCGIPARLEPGTIFPQYMADGEWIYAGERKSEPAGMLRLTGAAGSDEQAGYFKQFTIARIVDGSAVTLDFPFGAGIDYFSEPLSLSAGTYALVTSNRLGDTLLLSSLELFTIREGEITTLEVEPRLPVSGPPAGTPVNTTGYLRLDSDTISMGQLIAEGVVLAWIEPGREPSRHLLNELPATKAAFNEWGGTVVLVAPGGTVPNIDTDRMPERTIIADDPGYILLRSLSGTAEGRLPDMPFIVLVDGGGLLRFKSSGYSIGLPDRLIRAIR